MRPAELDDRVDDLELSVEVIEREDLDVGGLRVLRDRGRRDDGDEQKDRGHGGKRPPMADGGNHVTKLSFSGC